VATSIGPAHAAQADTGFYFYSLDGFIWRLARCVSLDSGFTNISYADGCFVAGGTTTTGGFITSSIDPRDVSKWAFLPPAAVSGPPASTPSRPIAYDANTGIFDFQFFPGGSTANIRNPLPPSPDSDPTWPHIGQDVAGVGGQSSVWGMGTAGPVEVRISIKDLIIPRRFGVISDLAPSGLFDMISQKEIGTTNFERIPYPSRFIQARKAGTSDYFSSLIYVAGTTNISFQNILSGNSYNSVGLVLRGLVWGIVDELAVEFAPGGT
jgi:hypothetical protein